MGRVEVSPEAKTPTKGPFDPEGDDQKQQDPRSVPIRFCASIEGL